MSIKSVVNKPIKFVGTGEKLDALDVFYPERMADRILGMGDIVSLVERAQEQFDEVEAAKRAEEDEQLAQCDEAKRGALRRKIEMNRTMRQQARELEEKKVKLATIRAKRDKPA